MTKAHDPKFVARNIGISTRSSPGTSHSHSSSPPDTPQCPVEARVMGVSSSQPDHSNQQHDAPSSAATSTGPGTDDFAASQQLVSESRADQGLDSSMATASGVSPSVRQLAARQKRKSDTRRLQSFELASLQAYVEESVGASHDYEGNEAPGDQEPFAETESSEAAVQVPDSQLIADTAPLSPPMTSSALIPASMPELPTPKSRTRKRKATRDEEEVARDRSPELEMGHHQNAKGDAASNSGLTSTSRSQHNLLQDEDTQLDEIEERTPLDQMEEPDTTQSKHAQETDPVTVQPRTTRKLKSRPSLLTPYLVKAAEAGSKKRQRKLKRAKDSHFEDPIESTPEDAAQDGDQNLNGHLVQGSPEVPGEKFPTVRKATKRHSNRQAVQGNDKRAPSLQTPTEPLRSPSNILRKHSDPLQRLSKEPLPKVDSSSSSAKKKFKSQVYDWKVSPAQTIDSRPNVGVFDEHALDSIVDSMQPENIATEDSVVEGVAMDDGAVEDSDSRASPRSIPNQGDKKTVKQRRSKNTRKRNSRESEQHVREPEPPKLHKKKNLNTISAAEEALQKVRDLPINPDKRTSGDFSADEEELIRRAIRDYQQMRGWEVSEMVKVIQWTMNDSNDRLQAGVAQDTDSRNSESREFWDDMNRTLVSGTLTRGFEAIRKHIRSHYHEFKRGGWTKEEDDELLRSFEQAPRQWKAIGALMGRSKTDVHARWSEYLQHREKRQYGRWTDKEEALLIRAVNTVAQRDEDAQYEAGHQPREVYTAENINWSQVVAEMGNTRGRLQASVKWKKMMARENPPEIRVHIKPRGPDAKPIPATTPRPRIRTQAGSAKRPRRLTSKSGRRQKQVAPATPTSHQPNTRSVHDADGVGTMLWGDKLDLVETIADARYQREEDIDWDATAAKMRQAWSRRTLQAALRDLLAIVKDDDDVQEQQSLQDRLDAVIDYLDQEHGGELAMHYNPFDVEMESADGHEEEDIPTIRSNTKRKRMRKMAGRKSLQESQPTRQRKKRNTAVDGLAKSKVSKTPVAKSKAIITESDEADSEAGL